LTKNLTSTAGFDTIEYDLLIIR